MQKEMTEAINKATADHELRMRQLQDRVDAMERSVNEVVSKNKEEEQRMRKVIRFFLSFSICFISLEKKFQLTAGQLSISTCLGTS